MNSTISIESVLELLHTEAGETDFVDHVLTVVKDDALIAQRAVDCLAWNATQEDTLRGIFRSWTDDPESAFTEDELAEWAENNGFKREE